MTAPGGGRPGPVARLFGSLASALLDLGLPTINGWLRERVGEAAEVASITTDGSVIHLEGVKVPIGPRGLVILDRASATVTPLGRGGLADIRLRAFRGNLIFGSAGSGPFFRAEVSFAASTDPDPSEEVPWIWGELRIQLAVWTAREGSPKANPMNGRARLFVSSLRWRLDQGNLDGEIVRARFAGAGVFEPDEEPREPVDRRAADAVLVPEILTNVALELDHARVGPFVDAASALVGATIAIPSVLPLDATLDGALSWNRETGAKASLRMGAPWLDAAVTGGLLPNGSGLGGKVTATFAPAVLLHRLGAPAEALPRPEDSAAVEIAAQGSLAHPELRGTITASELGFRLGRPRFVPPVRLHELRAELSLVGGELRARANARARGAAVEIVASADVRRGLPETLRAELRSRGLEAAFVRDVLSTLGAKHSLPIDLTTTIDLTFREAAFDGAIGAATARSAVALSAKRGSWSLSGTVDLDDVLPTGVFATASVRPRKGVVALAGDLTFTATGPVFRGTASAERLTLEVASRPDIPAYVVERATANVVLDTAAFAYDQLAFAGHGADFIARGRIALVPTSSRVDASPLHLQLERGGSELALALLPLARIELPLRPGLGARGRLVLAASGDLVVDLVLDTPAGTSLTVEVRLAGGRLDGSGLRGAAAFADLIALGALGDRSPILPEGVMTADLALAKGVVTGWCSATRLAFDLGTKGSEPPIVTDVTTKVRVDEQTIAWSELAGSAYGGRFRSRGIAERAGKVALHAEITLEDVTIEELPPIDGERPGRFVRGRLAGSAIARVAGSLRGSGSVRLEEAAFPALDLARDPLARYGLRPPSEDATAPATATLRLSDWGVVIRDVSIELHGARVSGKIGISRSDVLEGDGVIVLEEAYLRTSRLLTLPRVLAERIAVPLRIGGTTKAPLVEADLRRALGGLLRDNRLRNLARSAVEEAQILLGRPVPRSGEGAQDPAVDPLTDDELREQLAQRLEAHDADWASIAQRQGSPR